MLFVQPQTTSNMTLGPCHKPFGATNGLVTCLGVSLVAFDPIKSPQEEHTPKKPQTHKPHQS